MRSSADAWRDGSRWARVGQVGQAAWLFGNLYEGVVGMPQLLTDARPHRRPGLLTSGSPVRYFAPVAPMAVGATGTTLVRCWRAGGDRRLIAAAAGGAGVALALSGYLIRVVNLPLLRGSVPLTDPARRQLTASWHRANAVRLVALAVALVCYTRLVTDGAADAWCAPESRRG